jgi:ketosteroid isomerase-like protein
MSESSNRAGIQALVAAINARDLRALDQVFTEDVVMEWPQSGERIRGEKNRREIYSRFPSLPTVSPRRLTGSGDPYQAFFVLEMRDGRIAKETAYWSKSFSAPDWRASWVERI